MAVNTTQTKYFQNIGVGGDSLSFSTIATTMGVPATNIKFGDYKRKTGADVKFADVDGTADQKAAATGIVPDSYENQTCGVDGTGISAGSNHKVSSLKNMIKRYDVSLTGVAPTSETNIGPNGAIPGTETWDENMDLNIPKRITMDSSTFKASSVNSHAMKFDAAALNLEIRFNGTKVLGAPGTGGAGQTNNSSAGNGNPGGSALYLRNNTTRTSGDASTIKLYVSNNALLAGGGGGGGGGSLGNQSGSTTCSTVVTNNESTNSWRTGCPGCSSGTRNSCNHGHGRYFRGHGGFHQGHHYYTGWSISCTSGSEANNGTPARRNGGAGGVGRGSNNTGGAGGGSAGQAATSINCPSGSTQNTTGTANQGGTGASGGDYGAYGGSASGAGGAPGKWLNASSTRWAHIGASSNTILKGGTQ